MFRTIPDRP